ncbi:MAG TPA: trypsin-like peptidase domain-containing protein [Streptosporangiaceae bacterium]
MSAIYDPPRPAVPQQPGPGQQVPGQPGPYPQWPGYGGPGGPGGYGGGPGGPGGGPVRRFRSRLLVAAAAFALGAVTVLGLQAGHAGTGASTSQIAAKVSPGLVDVVSTLGFQQARAAGTGMVLTSSGEVLTNNHVIEGATSISVTDIGNGRTYPARVAGYDQSHDIAVLRLQGASGLKTVDLGNSDEAAVGQRVVALGNAGGKGGAPSVAEGHIVGLNAAITAHEESTGTSEQLTGLIHHDADIQPGDSGGPLVNNDGEVIGVDTAASASSGFSLGNGQQQSQTQAFAVPVNEALSIARQIGAGQASATVHIGATGFIGVNIASADNAAASGVQPGSGALITQTLPGSPAQDAGLAPGDVIVSAGGRSVTSPETLQAALRQHHPGDTVNIGWTDPDGQHQSASVQLATGPAG